VALYLRSPIRLLGVAISLKKSTGITLPLTLRQGVNMNVSGFNIKITGFIDEMRMFVRGMCNCVSHPTFPPNYYGYDIRMLVNISQLMCVCM
jgi:hypothetical protein